MKVIDVLDEDFVNYRLPSMTIAFPFCTFKCGKDICQNAELAELKLIEISAEKLVKRYLSNPISKSVVMQGLEPFDSFEDVKEFIAEFSKYSKDPVVIYTGYDKNEIEDKIKELRGLHENIIIKYGRYLPNQEQHFDEVLGVYLSSDNQYAERL